MNGKLVSVVIVNCNGRHFLEECLNSICSQTYRNIEVLFVDNASCDGSVEFVKERFPDVEVIPLRVNLGFAAANNIAIRQAKGEYIATLNNDAVANARWVEELVKAMDIDDNVGSCACKMLFFDKPTIINSEGIVLDYFGSALDRNIGAEDKSDKSCIEVVFGCCAGAALYRRSMLDDIGLFDEDFFIYYEDADLSARAYTAGWKCLYVPKAIVFHHLATYWKKFPSQKTYYRSRSRIYFVAKNFYGFKRMVMLFFVILNNFIQFPAFYASLKGTLHGFLSIRRFINKGREYRDKYISSNKKLLSLSPEFNIFKLIKRKIVFLRLGL